MKVKRKRRRRHYSFYNRKAVCYICWNGHECDGDPGIPRKKKKQYRKFLNLGFGCSVFDMVGPHSCNLGTTYKEDKKYFHNNNYFFRHEQAIRLLFRLGEYDGSMSFDQHMRLGFTWDDDNGLYCISGIEPLQFKQVGRMWMFDELTQMLNVIGVEITLVSSEKELLNLLTRKIRQGALYVPSDDDQLSRLRDQVEEGLPIRKITRKRIRRPQLSRYMSRYGHWITPGRSLVTH